jgi:hypothetical protein
MSDEEMTKKWEQLWPKIVAKAWVDEKYLQELVTQPDAVLAREGLPLIRGVQIKICKKSDYPGPTMLLPIPDKPEGIAISDLKNMIDNAVVASDCSGTSCCC